MGRRMISFKQYLIESRSAPLYHATSLENAVEIIKSNLLKAIPQIDAYYKPTQRFRKPTAFFTRSYRNAKLFGSYTNSPSPYVIFVVDQAKLNQRYKLKPIHNWHEKYQKYNKTNHKYDFSGKPYGIEYEEVADKDIKDFLKYVTEIKIDGNVDVIKRLIGNTNIPINNI